MVLLSSTRTDRPYFVLKSAFLLDGWLPLGVQTCTGALIKTEVRTGHTWQD